ncbi:MAG: sigma-54-dependent Fis family transcriptional regulator [Myxococcales bacterium]|nr:sigma-54-dependent Fis family transcriptional regulator [Myxococcales bacterium]
MLDHRSVPAREERADAALSILIADDDPDVRALIEVTLRSAGYRLMLAADGAGAAARLAASPVDILLCDIRMPKLDGLTLFRQVHRESPETDVILMSAFGDISEAVAAVQEGASDYVTKPFDPLLLALRVRRLAERRAIKRELRDAKAQLSARPGGPEIIAGSPAMTRLLARVDTIARSDAPVLISGESGTGKELIAHALHDRGGRRSGPFIAVNCAGLPETLIEAELFGHERGAFTGAVRKREGRFKAADGGTLLLDEIAEVPLPTQAKLLRVLQEGTIEPLGTNQPVHVDVRVISATHRNLKERIAEGLFREDLYYRLKVLDVTIPPLRERRSELPLLVQYFLRRFTPAEKTPPVISPRAWAALVEHDYPGNVRELAHAIEHAVVIAGGGAIDLPHLPSDVGGRPAYEPGVGASRVPASLAEAAGEFERQFLISTLRHAGGRRAEAAALLGISRKTLWEKLRAHGLTDSDFDDPS